MMKRVGQVLSLDLVSKAILGALGILLIRYMPAGEYATYTLLASIAAIVTSGVAGSLNRVYVLTAEKGRPGEAGQALGLQFLVIVLLALVGAPLILAIGADIWLLLALVFALSSAEFAKTCYQRELAFARFSTVEVARSILFAATVLLLIWNRGSEVDAYSVLAAQTVSLAIVALVSLQTPMKGASFKLGGVINYARRFTNRKHLELFAFFLVGGLFSQADILMLKILGDELMLATYGSAFRYYGLLSLALGAVHAVLLPTIRSSASGAELQAILAKHRQMLVLFAGAAAFAAAAASWALPWVDGGKYPQAVGAFRILCISAVVSFAFSPHTNLLLKFEAYGFLVGSIVCALTLHIASCLVLIPAHGAMGAAASTAAAAAALNLTHFLRARRLRSGGVYP